MPGKNGQCENGKTVAISARMEERQNGKNKVANKPIPEDGSTNASQITIDTEENTMKVRSEKSRMTLKTVITADQEPVTERWSGTFHSLQRQPLPPSSGLKWMEKPLPIHLNVITKRLFT